MESKKGDIRFAAAQRPAGQASGAQQAAAQSGSSKINKVLAGVIGLLLALALICAAVWMVTAKNDAVNGATTAVKKDQYQAVFLTNGQVYFGKVSASSGDYISLSDIYYLQVDQSVQPSTENKDTESQNATTDPNSNVQLVKLGNELHGPEDQMQISSKQVLFWENLKNDGKVAQAIAAYAKK